MAHYKRRQLFPGRMHTAETLKPCDATRETRGNCGCGSHDFRAAPLDTEPGARPNTF